MAGAQQRGLVQVNRFNARMRLELFAPSDDPPLLAGSVVGLALIARHGSRARKMAIPFGPFLALGGVVGMLIGDQLLDLYLG